MDPMTMGLISGGLQIFGGLSARASQSKANKEAYAANFARINQADAIKQNDLQLIAQDVNNELGMQLTGLVYDTLRASGTTAATTAEREVFGNTAARQQNMVAMKAALSKDSLVQAAEANMIEVQNQMRTQKYAYESQHADNAQTYKNAQAQLPSTLGIIAGGIGAGASAYSSGLSMEGAKTANALGQAQLGLVKSQNALLNQQYISLLGNQYAGGILK